MPELEHAEHSGEPTDSSQDARSTHPFKQHLNGADNIHRLKLLIDLINALRGLPAVPAAGPMVMTIAVGDLENRHYDVSSLAEALAQPRTTVFRCLDELQKQGIAELSREGRRTTIRLTDDGWATLSENFDKIRTTLDRFVAAQAEISIRRLKQGE